MMRILAVLGALGMFLIHSPGIAGPTLEITKVPQSNFVLPSSTLQYTIYYRNLDPSPPPPEPLVDIVWIVDSSGSMGEEQAALATNAQTFFDSMQGANFRLAVVDMDVTNSSPRSAPIRTNGNLGLPLVGTGEWTTNNVQFGNMVQVGITGATAEYGLVVVQETLDHYTFRAGALKVFILVTDEQEFAGQNAELPNAIASMNTNNVIVHAITRPAFTLYCGPGSITTATGGLCGDITLSDWSPTLDTIGQSIILNLGTASVTDTLPAGLSYISSSDNGTLNGSRVDWSLGPLPAGSSGTLTLVTQVTASPGSIILNSGQLFTEGAVPVQGGSTVLVISATYTATHSPTNTDSPTPTWTGTVTYSPTITPTPTWTSTFTWSPTPSPTPTPHPDLQLTKEVSSNFVSVGQTFTYSIIYQNIGNENAIQTSIWDTLPAGTSFVSASGLSTMVGNMVVWDLSTLTIQPGQVGSIWINVMTLPESIGQSITNVASSSFVNGAMPLEPALERISGPVTTYVTAPDEFGLDRNAFNPESGQKLFIRLSASRAGSARLTVYNSAGELVANLSYRNLEGPSAWLDSWDGTNDHGEIVASGVYLVHFAGPAHSSSRRIAVIR